MENNGHSVVLCDVPDWFYNHTSQGSFLVTQTAEILYVKYHQWHQNTRGIWMLMVTYDNILIIKSPSNIRFSIWSRNLKLCMLKNCWVSSSLWVCYLFLMIRSAAMNNGPHLETANYFFPENIQDLYESSLIDNNKNIIWWNLGYCRVEWRSKRSKTMVWMVVEENDVWRGLFC